MTSKIKDNPDSLAQRIEKSKKEKEELKAKLQSLIDSGINSSLAFNKILDNSQNVEQPSTLHSTNKIQIIKSHDPNHSKTLKAAEPKVKETKSCSQKEMLNKQQTEEESPRKVRNYNVQEAREYMRKQREKRLEELKSKKKENVNLVELQKQKLQELHKKSLELVTKNLNSKRGRSKSRERPSYVRPDTNNPLVKQRSISRERLNEPNIKLLPSRSLSCDRVDKIRDITQKPIKDKTLSSTITQWTRLKQSNKSQHKVSKDVDNSTLKSSEKPYKFTSGESYGEIIQKKCPDLLYPPDHPLYTFNSTNPMPPREEPTGFSNKLNNFREDQEVSALVGDCQANATKSKTSIQILSNITLRKPIEYTEEYTIKSSDSRIIQRIIPHISNEEMSEHHNSNAIQKYKSKKDTKETQTNMPEPIWLKQSIQPDPFNFINAVRKKLQDSNIATRCTNDVGIQAENTFKDIQPKLSPKQNSNRSTSEKVSKRSDLKSFISHKCLDLDPKSIQHIELFSRNTNIDHKNLSKKNHNDDFQLDSESDTSKNIPEISTESATSLQSKLSEKQQYSGERHDLKMNTDTIDNMKLHIQDLKHVSKDTNSDLEGYFSDSHATGSNKNKKNLLKLNKSCGGPPTPKQDNFYSPDFNSSITETGANMSRSRESIISYNRSNYSKISPSKSNLSTTQSANSSRKIDDDKVLSVPLTTSMHTKISGQDDAMKSNSSNRIIEKCSKNDHSFTVSSPPKDTALPSQLSITNPSSTSKSAVSKKSEQFKSLYSELRPSFEQPPSKISEEILEYSGLNFNQSHISSLVKKSNESDQTKSKLNTDVSFSNSNKITITPEPSVFFKNSSKSKPQQLKDLNKGGKKSIMKNVSVRSFDRTGESNNTNEIHLKFEAEIHLLNDFNESLKHFAEVEKAFHSLRVKNDVPNTSQQKILQNQDTQTSFRTKNSKTSSTTKVSSNISDVSKSQISTINYTRGSDINEDFNSIILNSSVPKHSEEDNTSIVSLGVDFSHNTNTSKQSFKDSESKKNQSYATLENFENLFPKDFAGMSLSMFDQLIRDEDVRLENLKTILKIREQALLDRTKAELAWLEIQRKHLKETGKLQEASLVKKKQRGILLKHQQERHEMNRLKQMQKAESIERKTILKAQRNIIKHQLSTENMLSKIKMNTPRKGKHLGPLKVIQTHSESVRSETSISVKSSPDVDIHSVTSHSYSVISKVSEISETKDKHPDLCGQSGIPVTQVKRTLLMRESALQKRRKAAEELLQWHRKLLEEEKRIKELEETASAIISQIPNISPKSNSNDGQHERKYKFSGHQLNQLWFNLTGSEEKKFKEDKVYPMSQMALERFCKNAKEYSHKSKDILKKVECDVNSTKTSDNVNELGILNLNQNIPHNAESPSGSLVTDIRNLNSSKHSSTSNIPSETSINDYTSDFDIDIEPINVVNVGNVQVEEMNNISSISELIDNFSKIKTDISALRITQKVSSELDESSESLKTDPSILERESQEASVIETTKPSKTEPSVCQNDTEKLISLATFDNEEIEQSEDVKDVVAPAKIVLSDATEIDKSETLETIDELENTLETSSSTNIDKLEKNEKIEIPEMLDIFIDNHKNEAISDENLNIESIIQDSPQDELPTEENITKYSSNKDRTEKTNSHIDSDITTKIESDIKEVSEVSEPHESEKETEIEKDLPKLVQIPVEKEELNAFEEKEQDSLSSIQSISTDKNEDESKEISPLSEELLIQSFESEKGIHQSIPSEHQEQSPDEESNVFLKSVQSNESVSVEMGSPGAESVKESKSVATVLSEAEVSSSSLSNSEKKSPKIDVKKRVFEILSDASPVLREDKSPRLQDLYTTTYDLVSPVGSPEVGSPTKENKSLISKDIFGNEAEELLKKQLAIEQEIKEITEQQQKGQIPYLFVREIPNKPPPPYTPPGSALSSLVLTTILPTNKEVEEITKYSAKIIHKAYLNNNLEKIMISDNTLNLIAKNIDKSCYKFVFDLCKEIAIEHYNQFNKEEVSTWLQVTKKPQLAVVKPLDVKGLEKHMNKKLLEIFGFKKPEIRENTIIKWSRKKRDHVDEILVIECQAEESRWTNFDKDELLVMNDVTDDILNILLKESAEVLNKALLKKGYLH